MAAVADLLPPGIPRHSGPTGKPPARRPGAPPGTIPGAGDSAKAFPGQDPEELSR